ncbi:Uncharacterised protein [Leminorella richardii]|uniref:Uncharacterized protein n=1 Tax=Leminorella richardii TaxID=158841 RepID=A0A2X4UTY3_9GAMM|nr:Uncharacterised protein [Leminorella richardii]
MGFIGIPLIFIFCCLVIALWNVSLKMNGQHSFGRTLLFAVLFGCSLLVGWFIYFLLTHH